MFDPDKFDTIRSVGFEYTYHYDEAYQKSWSLLSPTVGGCAIRHAGPGTEKHIYLYIPRNKLRDFIAFMTNAADALDKDEQQAEVYKASSRLTKT